MGAWTNSALYDGRLAACFRYIRANSKHPPFVTVFKTVSQFLKLLLLPFWDNTRVELFSDLTKFSMNVKLLDCKLE